MKNGSRFVAFVGAMLIGQAALAVPATYTIDNGSLPGSTTNWLYRVNNNCNGTSVLDLNHNNRADVLHFCGNVYYEITGAISGDWDGQTLTGLSGTLKDGKIIGGSLGGAFYDAAMKPLWTIVTDLFGTFIFEDLNPAVNTITETTLTLWGQNLKAYGVSELCARAAGPGTTACAAKAIDVTGTVSVPEPTTLLMLALGLGAVAWTVRRKVATIRQ